MDRNFTKIIGAIIILSVLVIGYSYISTGELFSITGYNYKLHPTSDTFCKYMYEDSRTTSNGIAEFQLCADPNNLNVNGTALHLCDASGSRFPDGSLKYVYSWKGYVIGKCGHTGGISNECSALNYKCGINFNDNKHYYSCNVNTTTGNTWLDNGLVIGKCGYEGEQPPVIVDECYSPQTKCNGTTYYVCQVDNTNGNKWFSMGDVVGKCGVQSCTPKTCAQQNFNCGIASDQCSGVLNCGTAPAGYSCKNNYIVQDSQCSPKTCQQLIDEGKITSRYVGLVDDGCGTYISCQGADACIAPEVRNKETGVCEILPPKMNIVVIIGLIIAFGIGVYLLLGNNKKGRGK